MFFISYCHKDQAFVRELKRRLKEAGFIPWTDEDILPGEQWKQVIDTAIQESIGVVVVLTEASAASPYVTYEWAFAMGLDGGRKPIIPVLVETINEGAHPKLVDKQWINFSDPENPHWQELIERLSTIASYGRASDAIKNAEHTLDSANPIERQHAIQTLEHSLDPLANDALARAMQHPTRDVRTQAVLALSRKEYPLDNTALPALKLLLDGELETCKIALKTLGKIGTEEAIGIVENILRKNTNHFVRDTAVQVLADVKSATSIPVLIQALDDKNDNVKLQAVSALSAIQELSTIPDLGSHFKNTLRFNQASSVDLQVALLNALKNFGEPGAIALGDILSTTETNSAISIKIIEALDEIGGEVSFNILQQVLKKEKHPGYRRLINEAITSIKHRLDAMPKTITEDDS